MKVAVLGIGQTKFGELWDQSLTDLLAQSQSAALADAQILPTDIDAIFTGTMCAGLFLNQSNVGAIAAQLLNTRVANTHVVNTHVPSTVVEGACASGGLALRAGIMAIESGHASIVLVNGVEKMTDVSSQEVTNGLVSAASYESEQMQGATFPALNALIARLYMHTHGVTREQLAQVSVQNHAHGYDNPYAHVQRKITVDDVLSSPMIADPLTLLDCSPISDGAASIILCNEHIALQRVARQRNTSVFITGSGQASDTLALSDRENLLSWQATKIAAQHAYDMAGITPEQIDVVELHDAFSIVQLLVVNDLSLPDSVVVNPSGGLKSRGHPVGATGVVQAVEIVKLLRDGARVGLTHNVGGCGTTVVVHVLQRGSL